MKVLVIGGTLFIGRHLVDELVKAGHDVAVLHRKPKHDFGTRVENLQADRNDAAAVQRSLAGRRFDVVFDNVYDWERGTTAAQVEATVRACGDRLTPLYFHVQRGRLRRRPESLRKATRWRPDNHPDPYVRNKATTERLLFRMHAQHGLAGGDLPAAVRLRPGQSFLPRAFFWDRMRAGRPIIIPGDGHRLMQFVYVNDLVQAMVRVHGGAARGGRSVQHRRPQARDAGGVVREAGAQPPMWSRRWCASPATPSCRPAATPWASPITSASISTCRPSPRTSAKCTRILKIKLTPFEAGLKETYRWYTRNHKPRTAGFEFDDKLLAMVKTDSTANV